MQTDFGLSARRADRVLGAVAFGAALSAAGARRRSIDRCDAGAPEGQPLLRYLAALRRGIEAARLGQDPLQTPAVANDTWLADFATDALWSGRRFRTFNVTDDFNRECLKIEIDTKMLPTRAIRALDELVELRGVPQRLRLNNDPELISAALRDQAEWHRVELVHIQPAKRTHGIAYEIYRTSTEPNIRFS